MEILEQKSGTKRPVIVRAATSLFARRGVDATSMRDIAEAAGVREAAIYRHFASKDDLSREIFASWYGWYSRQLREIARGPGGVRQKVHRAAELELATARQHPEAFLYFCSNEPRFVRSLPPDVPRARDVFIELVKRGQERREVRAGDAGLLGGALCAAALSSIQRRKRGDRSNQLDLVASSCWALIAA
jgi:AcrR family transcriptional regulator